MPIILGKRGKLILYMFLNVYLKSKSISRQANIASAYNANKRLVELVEMVDSYHEQLYGF